jgi:hypothetical protein
MITLHRVKNFRSLALDLRQDYSFTASGDAVGNSDSVSVGGKPTRLKSHPNPTKGR